MTAPRHDVLALGNAIVDVLARTEDDFLLAHGLEKGAMRLISEAEAEAIYKAMGPAHIISGGSAANTAVGIASLGARAAFIGKVKDDEVGRLFTHDIRAAKVDFNSPVAKDGPATARSFILVTPDGERTMNTYLGACQNLSSDDVTEEAVASSAIIYLEGYLWDPPAAKEAFRKAAELAHKHGRKVALTLSDSFCVDRWRDEFLDLMRSGMIDILFANEHELRALYVAPRTEDALSALRAENGVLGVVTLSEKGSVVVTRDETLAVPAFPIHELIDTTGAGDLFAAGFITGLARNKSYRDCARLGALAAAEIIQHLGARPEKDLAALAAENGLA